MRGDVLPRARVLDHGGGSRAGRDLGGRVTQRGHGAVDVGGGRGRATAKSAGRRCGRRRRSPSTSGWDRACARRRPSRPRRSTPRASSACSSGSAGSPGKASELMCGARAAPVTVGRAPGTAASAAASSRSRSAATATSAPASSARRASATARPNPTMPGRFSVPPRRPRSWPPPIPERRDAGAGANPEGSRPLRPVQLVRRERQRVGAERARPQAQQAERLHAVDVQVRPTSRVRREQSGDLAGDLADRLDGADLVVDQHDGDDRRVGTDGRGDRLGPAPRRRGPARPPSARSPRRPAPRQLASQPGARWR